MSAILLAGHLDLMMMELMVLMILLDLIFFFEGGETGFDGTIGFF